MGQHVVGTCDGYDEFAAAGDALVERIDRSCADVVLVAFGNPSQERWILDHADTLASAAYLRRRRLLDFLAGNARRAPNWVRRLRMEWLYRLLNEPRRSFKRYSWDLIVFFRVSACGRASAWIDLEPCSREEDLSIGRRGDRLSIAYTHPRD